MKTSRSLARVLKLPTLVAVSAGMALASSCFPLLASVLMTGREGVAWAIGASGLLCGAVALCFARLAARFPSAAGLRTYILHGFGERCAMAISYLYLGLVVSVAVAETCAFGAVVRAYFPTLSPRLLVVGFLVMTAAINLAGVELAGRWQTGLTVILFGCLLCLALQGLIAPADVGVGAPATMSAELSWWEVGAAAGACVFLFVGFEWVTPLAEETAEPGALALALPAAVALLTGLYLLLAFAMLANGTPADYAATQTPQLLFGTRIGGRWGSVAMGAVSAAATLTSLNAGLLGASRLVYGLAREGALPAVLARLTPRTCVPWVAILALLSISVAAAMAVTDAAATIVPILVAAAIECVVYAAVCASAVRLAGVGVLGSLASWDVLAGTGAAAAFGLLGVGVLGTRTPWQPAVMVTFCGCAGFAWLGARWVTRYQHG